MGWNTAFVPGNKISIFYILIQAYLNPHPPDSASLDGSGVRKAAYICAYTIITVESQWKYSLCTWSRQEQLIWGSILPVCAGEGSHSPCDGLTMSQLSCRAMGTASCSGAGSYPGPGKVPCPASVLCVCSPAIELSCVWKSLKIYLLFFFFFPPLKTQVAIDHPDWVTQYVMPRNPAVILRWAYMWCMFKGSKACMEETPSLLCRCTQKKRECDVWSICLAPGGLSVCRLGVLWGSPRACGECKRLSSTITLLLASSEHQGPQGLLNSVVQVAKGLCHHYSALFCFLWATKPLPMALPRTQCCQCSFQKAMQQASTRSENHRIQYWITES